MNANLSPSAVTDEDAGRRTTARDRVVDFIRGRPLLTLLLVFNTFGQLVAFLPVIARRRYGVELDVDLVLIPTILFLLLPALLIARVSHGEAAVRALLHSVVKFDVAPGWYLLPFVVLPVSVMAGVRSSTRRFRWLAIRCLCIRPGRECRPGHGTVSTMSLNWRRQLPAAASGVTERRRNTRTSGKSAENQGSSALA